MNHKKKVFLQADWQYLAMLNYIVDPTILVKHLPPYTTLDLFEGKALVSVVGFLFNNTKVLGVKWPFHVNFEEVNLRYYIKHYDGTNWKRGVGFISEIVPKPAIAIMANVLYNEHYSVATMSHQIDKNDDVIKATFHWKKWQQANNVLSIQAKNTPTSITPKSEEEFIFEHYYGYNKLNNQTTIEYAVEHPRWQTYPVMESHLQCDVEKLYGAEFVPFINNITPHSAYLAEGSSVIVRKPVYIKKQP
jgi:uncharacterized protein